MEQILILRDNAKAQLMELKTVEDGMNYLNKVKAIEVWAKAEKKDSELQNIVAEQKIRTQRVLGQMIKDGQEAGEIATPGGDRQSIVPDGNNGKTLAEVGISRKESSTFKAIASIPNDIFEEAITEKKQSVDKAVSELTTAGMLSIAKGKVHVSNNSGENEWYTPPEIIELARLVMRGIDLDPASSEIANKVVKATDFYTKEDDGLSKKWNGNVWMNPPYSQPLISNFSNAVTEKFISGEISQVCILVNNATETNWFQEMMKPSSAICLIKGRIKFIDTDGNATGSPLQGQAIIYLGNNASLFYKNFKSIGTVLWREER